MSVRQAHTKHRLKLQPIKDVYHNSPPQRAKGVNLTRIQFSSLHYRIQPVCFTRTSSWDVALLNSPSHKYDVKGVFAIA